MSSESQTQDQYGLDYSKVEELTHNSSRYNILGVLSDLYETSRLVQDPPCVGI